MAMSTRLDQIRQERFREAARIRDSVFKEEELGSLGQYYKDIAERYRKKADEARPEYTKYKTYFEDAFKKAQQKMVLDKYIEETNRSSRIKRQPEIDRNIYDAIVSSSYQDYLEKNNMRRYSRNPFNDRFFYFNFPAARTTQPLTEEQWRQEREKVTQALINSNAEITTLPTENIFIDLDGSRLDFSRFIDRGTGERISVEEILRRDTSKRGNIFYYGQRANNYLAATQQLEQAESEAKRFEGNYQQELIMLAQRNKENKERFLRERQEQLSALQGAQGSYRGATYTEKPL